MFDADPLTGELERRRDQNPSAQKWKAEPRRRKNDVA